MIATAPNSVTTPNVNPVPELAANQLETMIAEAAYYIAQRRGFEPGHELEDWLAAEAQVFDTLSAPTR